jgi:D-amino-acid dehydrogenase
VKYDVVVLGAGIVGVSAAFHLAARGRSVAMLDLRGPGEETSFGNTGVIERSALLPIPFPRDAKFLVELAFGMRPHAHYHPLALPNLAPWLWAYFKSSSPAGREASARALHPLVDRSLAEHEALMQAAGSLDYLRRNGWITIYRTAKSLAGEEHELQLAREFGVPYEVHGMRETQALEPGLAPVFEAGILWPSTATVSDPGAVTKSYATLAETRGVRILVGDARTLVRSAGGWTVQSAEGPVAASQALVALGAWSPQVLEPLGVVLPLASKRGYHMHFSFSPPALSRPIVDSDGGFAMSPMRRGIRLTTGIEFAERDAPPTPVQIDRALPFARQILPSLGEKLDPEPWLGRRPCFPDSLPVIGPAPGQDDLFLAFGHQHLGFTLGPVSGRLVAELMCGAEPVVDPSAYRAERFG